MLIFTFLSTIVKYMWVDLLCFYYNGKKMNFVCWLNTVSYWWKTPYRRNSALINVMGNLHPRGKWLSSGLVNLNEIVPAQMKIVWKGYGFCFLGFQWHIFHRIVWKKNNQQRLLLCIIEPIERVNDLISSRKNVVFCKTMHQLTNRCKRWQKSMNHTSSCFFAHLILQIWPSLRKWLQGQRFSSNEKVKWGTDGQFAGLDKSYHKRSIEILKVRWTKCIELKGDYVLVIHAWLI